MMIDANSVHNMIRRSNRNTLLLTIVGIIILIVAIVTAAPYWMQTLGEPKILSAAEVTNLAPESLPMYNVTISGDRMFGTFYEEYVREDNGTERTTAWFGTLRLENDKFVVVRENKEVDESVTSYTGYLFMPESIDRDAVNSLKTETPEIAADVLPFVLDPHPDNAPWIFGAVAIVVMALLVVWGFVTFLSRSRNSSNHPIMKGLARYGNTDAALEQISGEAALGEQKQSFPGLSFTRNWLVYAKGTTFEAVRFEDVMWIYPQSVRNRYGTNYYTHLWDRHGRLINVQGSEMQVNDMIRAVLGRAPWAIGGYSEDIKKSWNGSRAQFVATVDGRKQQGVQ
jgi:hypothetical protein